MSLQLFNRIEQVDFLISCKSTGKPKEFAMKIRISERSLYDTINLMKKLGAPILYCKQKKTYFYGETGKLLIGFIYVNGGKENNFFSNQNIVQAVNYCVFLIQGLIFIT